MMRTLGTARFVHTPELTNVGETVVTNFRVAVDEFKRRNDGETIKNTYFFDCEAWDAGARVICQRAEKGDVIYMDGRPRQHQWEDKDGKKCSRVVFRVEEFQILPKLNKTTETVDAQ